MNIARNNVQKVLGVPEVGADASHCTLYRVCSAAVVQIQDLVVCDCRLALNTLAGIVFCKERGVHSESVASTFRAGSAKTV